MSRGQKFFAIELLLVVMGVSSALADPTPPPPLPRVPGHVQESVERGETKYGDKRPDREPGAVGNTFLDRSYLDLSIPNEDKTAYDSMAHSGYDRGIPDGIEEDIHSLDFWTDIWPFLEAGLNPDTPNSCTEYELDEFERCVEYGRDITGQIAWVDSFPSVKYRYPVDKVESHRVPFLSRYMTIDYVRENLGQVLSDPQDPRAPGGNISIKDRVEKQLNRSVKESEDYLRSRGLTPVPVPSLSIPEDAVNAATSFTRTRLRSADMPTSGSRGLEYRAMPEVFSRVYYQMIHDSFFIEIIRRHWDEWSGYSEWDDIMAPICHRNKPPTTWEEYDKKKHMWASECPRDEFNMGGFMVSRYQYEVYDDPKLSPFRSKMNAFLDNPLICFGYNMDGYPGISDPKMMGKLKGPNSDPQGVCLPGNNGPLVPFTNIAYTKYDTVGAAVGFRKGALLSYTYNRDNFYDFDYDDDAVQWINWPFDPDNPYASVGLVGNKGYMPVGCMEPNLPYYEYELRERDPRDIGIGPEYPQEHNSNQELPTDVGNTAVKWRKFHCCPRGDPCGWEIFLIDPRLCPIPGWNDKTE